MKHYYLGMAAGYAGGRWLSHLCTIGVRRDRTELKRFLTQKYGGRAVLCKNGRSALALALKAYFEPGDAIIVNGFTCYAVYEAIIAAHLRPIFADISRDDLNFTVQSISKAMLRGEQVRGIIVQNSLGNPVEMRKIEKLADKHQLLLIEDLAHCAGVRYDDKREAGTVGAATILSFGKDKSIDTISGGALILRTLPRHEIAEPTKAPRPSDHLRAKFYPMFGALCRTLSYIRLGGPLMRVLVAMHWVEKSADNKLDLKRRLSNFEAKLALKQLKELRKGGEPPLRGFCYVRNRQEVLHKLMRAGFYFGSFWYEKPVSPARYYGKVKFPEEDCPNAVYVGEHIINLPNCCSRRDLRPAYKIIKHYLEEGADE